MKYLNDTTEGEQSPHVPESIQEIMQSGLEMKLHMVQHHAQMAYVLAGELLNEELVHLTGEKHERDKPLGGRFRRWGTNPGSVRIDGERVPIRVPRVRDVEVSRERPLESYQHLKKGIDIDEKLEKSILLGLSTRDYAGLAGSFLDGFGISQSSVSRAFQERSSKALETFEERRFDGDEFLALWIDGKYARAPSSGDLHGLNKRRAQDSAGIRRDYDRECGSRQGASAAPHSSWTLVRGRNTVHHRRIERALQGGAGGFR